MCDLKIKTVLKNSSNSAFSSMTDPRNRLEKNIFPTFLELQKWCQEFFGSRMCALLRKTGIECFFS